MSLVHAPKTTKGSRTREKVFTEARRIIIEQGFDALAMRDLAKRCEIRLGNLQYYFATRDAVAIAVVTAEAEGDIEAVNAAIEEHEDPKAALAAIVRTLFTRWRGESGLVYAALTYLTLQKPEFKALKTQIYARFYESLSAVTRLLDPTVTPAQMRQRVALITAVMDGSVLQETGGARAFVDAVTATVLAIALGGVQVD